MILERFTVGPFAENCYLIGKAPRVAIVDPGGESERIAAVIDEHGWKPEAILLTHGHIDHVAHCCHLAERYALPVFMHRADLFLLQSAQFPEFANMLGARPCPEPAGYLEEGTPVDVAGLVLRVLHTPGHTPGSVSLHVPDAGLLFSGDTLFRGSIGRTDLPGGDTPTIMRSITERLLTLPDDTRVLPGHMSETTICAERHHNPFIRAYQEGRPW